jgi:hypothetical protein
MGADRMRNQMKDQMRNLIYFLIFSTFVISGCEQDPMKNQPDYVKNAVPGVQKPAVEKPAALKPEEMMIRIIEDGPYKFVEEVETKLTFEAKVLRGKFNSGLTFINAAEFPGATFDEATGVFTWKPPRGSTEGKVGITKEVLLEMWADDDESDSISYSRQKPFTITIERAESIPEIISIDNLKNGDNVRENQSRNFTVTVKDLDARDMEGMKPQLFIASSIYTSRNMAEYITIVGQPERDRNNPNNWKFFLQINLKEVDDFTDSKTAADFQLFVMSRFGIRSVTKPLSVFVLNDIQQATTTLNSNVIQIKEGVEFEYSFSIFEPRFSGLISANWDQAALDNIPGAKTLSCVRSTNKTILDCRLKWLVPVGTVPADKDSLEYRFAINSQVQSSVIGDEAYVKKQTHNLTFKMIKGLQP